MRREFIVSVELNTELEEALINIRWKHIDIDELMNEELTKQAERIIRAYGETE